MDSLLNIGLNNAAWAAVMALGVAIAARVSRRHPALVHALWLLVLLKLLTPSLVELDPRGWTDVARVVEGPSSTTHQVVALRPPAAPSASQPLTPLAHELPAPSQPLEGQRWSWPWRWQATVGVVWLCGSILWCSTVASGVFRLRRLIRSARPASDDLRARIEHLAARLELRRLPTTHMSPVLIPPMLWALVGHPRLILPEDLWARLGDDERDAILAHELAHLKRRDQWTRRLEALALGLYWWNPVAWWARREIERAEEQCCDTWVLWALPGCAAAYAHALVQTADFLSESHSRHPWPAGASGAGHLPPLKRRLSMILNHSGKVESEVPSRGLRLPLVFAILSLFLLPAWALSEPPKAEPSPEALRAARASFEEKYETGKEGSKPDAKPPVLDAPPEIAEKAKFAQVISGQVSDYQIFAATLEDATPINIVSPRRGAAKALVSSGAVVKKDEVLFDYKSGDEHDFMQSEQNVKGLKQLLADRAIELKQLESIENADPKVSTNLDSVRREQTELARNLRDAEGRMDRAKTLAQSDVRITSPLRGTVRHSVIFGKGNPVLVGEGTQLATIVPADTLAVDFHLDQATYLKMKRRKIATGEKSPLDPGSSVEVSVEREGDTILGQMELVESRFDPKSHTLRCRASIPNPGGVFIPGMSASLALFTSAPHKVLLMPSEAWLDSDASICRVLVVDPRRNVLENRTVHVGRKYRGSHVVIGGLKEGEWVVIAGHDKASVIGKVKPAGR